MIQGVISLISLMSRILQWGISLAALSENTTPGDCFNISCGEGRSLLEAINILKESFPSLEVNSKEGNGFTQKEGIRYTKG